MNDGACGDNGRCCDSISCIANNPDKGFACSCHSGYEGEFCTEKSKYELIKDPKSCNSEVLHPYT